MINIKTENVTFGARVWLVIGIAMLLLACASRPQPLVEDLKPVAVPDLASSPWAVASSASGNPAAWQHQEFPGKRASHYRYTRSDGRDAMLVRAASSASMLRQVTRVEPTELSQLRFSWKVPALIESADLSVRDQADSPVRIVLAFEGDRSKFSAKDAMLSELAHALTGEPMPYATLMYVWCNQAQSGTVITSPRTSRIRKLVMESGPGKLSQWLDYERDIRADFVKAFGEPPGALLAIGIMTDSDNTQSTTQAWYGPVRHVPAAGAPKALR